MSSLKVFFSLSFSLSQFSKNLFNGAFQENGVDHSIMYIMLRSFTSGVKARSDITLKLMHSSYYNFVTCGSEVASSYQVGILSSGRICNSISSISECPILTGMLHWNTRKQLLIMIQNLS